MNRFFSFVALFTLCLLPLQAQELGARLLMKNDELWSVTIAPRRAGTTQIVVTRKDREGQLTVKLDEVKKIYFDLQDFKPTTIQRLFVLGRYEEVIEALKGRVIPYFAYVDTDANSNQLISMFVRSLYHAENYAGVRASANEIGKYTVSGDLRRMADIYLALSYLKQEQPEAFEEMENRFPEPELDDPLASPIWYGRAMRAMSSNDWTSAHPPLAKIITEKPLDTEWVGEALYLTAEQHHSVSNLVVANQICQEIQMVVPSEIWKEKSMALQSEIQTLAEELEITLKGVGEERRVDDGSDAGEAKIDYKKRQRELEEAERNERLGIVVEDNEDADPDAMDEDPDAMDEEPEP